MAVTARAARIIQHATASRPLPSPTAAVAGQHDDGDHATHADRADELGDKATAARPHVEPQLDQHQRHDHHERHPERRSLENEGGCDKE